MALNIIKPIDNPQHISILVPTRGRPECVSRLFDSIEATTQEKQLIDVWMYVDEDDLETRQLAQKEASRYAFPIHTVVGPRTHTMGEMFNALREQCATNPGIYMTAGDKILFVTQAWDKIVRETFNQWPDRILFAYASDPVCGNIGAYGFFSGEWTNHLGQIFTEFFPFWYDDFWSATVAEMIQRKVKLEVEVTFQYEEGKGETQRLRNLMFWSMFIYNLMDVIIAEAEVLRRMIYKVGSPSYLQSIEKGNEVAEDFLKWQKNVIENCEAEIQSMERRFSGGDYDNRNWADKYYLRSEINATNHLCQKVFSKIKSGEIGDAVFLLDNVLCGFQRFRGIQYVRAVCLMILGRREEAREAAAEELELEPESEKTLQMIAELQLSGAKETSNVDDVATEDAYQVCKSYDVEGVLRSVFDGDAEVWKKAIELNEQGEECLERGETENAGAAFTESIAIAPGFGRPYHNLGLMLTRSGDDRKSLSYAMRALRIAPYDRDIAINVAGRCRAAGLLDDAKWIYSAYLRRNLYDDFVWGLLKELDPAVPE
ncbi:MAG: hypothetical protein GY847_21295 [Proteobacteria bacterium]|nr:hypothetical protein [Pseudomonadota bacterium]